MTIDCGLPVHRMEFVGGPHDRKCADLDVLISATAVSDTFTFTEGFPCISLDDLLYPSFSVKRRPKSEKSVYKLRHAPVNGVAVYDFVGPE